MTKSALKTAVAAMEALDATEIETVLAEVVMQHRPTRCVQDVADPGESVDPDGDDECVVSIEEMSALERIINPDNNLLPVAFLEEGVVRQRAVARVALTQAHAGLPAGSGWGTGWLVSPDLLMTNNHVIPDAAFARRVRAEFNYQNDEAGSPLAPDAYQFDPDSFFYTNASLDFTLVRVKCRQLWLPNFGVTVRPTADGEWVLAPELTPDPNGPIDVDPPRFGNGIGTRVRVPDLTAFRPPFRLCTPPGVRWGHLQLPAGSVSYAADMHVNIVQHPRGRRKEIAVQQNRLDVTFTNHVRYTTDTEPGSSGSPVFNNAWDLLAIHHAGGEFTGGMWINNQGVRVDRIVNDIRANVAAAVQSSLGI